MNRLSGSSTLIMIEELGIEWETMAEHIKGLGESYAELQGIMAKLYGVKLIENNTDRSVDSSM
jgi:hypothetical protein